MKTTQRKLPVAILIVVSILMLTLSACGNAGKNSEVTETDSATVNEAVESITESEDEVIESVTGSDPVAETTEAEAEPAEEYSNTLVVYFSHTGNTKPSIVTSS